MEISASAGGIIVSPKGLIAVTNQDGVSWSLPKGRLEVGEDELTAAKREILEETGIEQVILIKKLGTYERYKIGKGGKGENKTIKKIITLFLFTTDQEKLEPQDPDNPEARWVSPDKVTEFLTHQADKDFYNSKLPEVARLIKARRL